MLIAVLIATDSATRVGMYDVFAAEGLRSAKTSDDQGLVFACAQRPAARSGAPAEAGADRPPGALPKLSLSLTGVVQEFHNLGAGHDARGGLRRRDNVSIQGGDRSRGDLRRNAANNT